MDVLSTVFHALPPMGVLGSRQSILPCSDGAFSIVQLPLLSEELLL
jgi:hypothetical protein